MAARDWDGATYDRLSSPQEAWAAVVLDRLPLREVKIDQSFVFRLEREETDATIIRATVALAHDLGLRVVAEGVENDLARSLVTAVGCDLIQGYGLARPMTPGEVLPWLVRHDALLASVTGAALSPTLSSVR